MSDRELLIELQQNCDPTAPATEEQSFDNFVPWCAVHPVIWELELFQVATQKIFAWQKAADALE